MKVRPSSVASYSLNNVMRVTKLGQKFPYLVVSLMMSPYLNIRVMCWPSIHNSIQKSTLPPKTLFTLFSENAHNSLSNGYRMFILVSICGFSMARKPMEPMFTVLQQWVKPEYCHFRKSALTKNGESGKCCIIAKIAYWAVQKKTHLVLKCYPNFF